METRELPLSELLEEKARSEKACRLAEKDPKLAFVLAQQVRDPWYRCQVLAYVAKRETDVQAKLRIIQHAFDAAKLTNEPNRIVSVSSWPIEVLVEIGEEECVEKEVNRLLHVIAAEPHPTRRGDAILMLLLKLVKGPPKSLVAVFDAFLTACLVGHGWKRDRNLRDAAVFLGQMGLNREKDMCIAQIENQRVKRQAIKKGSAQ